MKIRTAVVGAGFIGPVHVEALGRAGVEVIGILGVSRDESESADPTYRRERRDARSTSEASSSSVAAWVTRATTSWASSTTTTS